MTKKEYNGWTNYETWKVALWIDNDHYYYEETRQIVQDLKERGFIGNQLMWNVADQLEDTVYLDLDEQCGNDTLIGDLARSALENVNWNEIALNIIEED